jgi:hypothetical protein
MERARHGKKIFASCGGSFFSYQTRHTLGLKNRDLLSICVNAIHAGSTDADPTKWKVTQEAVQREIEKGEDGAFRQ